MQKSINPNYFHEGRQEKINNLFLFKIKNSLPYRRIYYEYYAGFSKSKWIETSKHENIRQSIYQKIILFSTRDFIVRNNL